MLPKILDLQINGLPGKVKTGCISTPAHMSRYCAVHKPTVFTPHIENDGGNTSASATRAHSPPRDCLHSGEKTTRHNTFYEVCMYAPTHVTSIE